jgi:hypothetical protein
MYTMCVLREIIHLNERNDLAHADLSSTQIDLHHVFADTWTVGIT